MKYSKYKDFLPAYEIDTIVGNTIYNSIFLSTKAKTYLDISRLIVRSQTTLNDTTVVA